MSAPAERDPEPLQTLAEWIFGLSKGQWFPTQAEAGRVADFARQGLHEVWKLVGDFAPNYEASDQGRVRHVINRRPLAQRHKSFDGVALVATINRNAKRVPVCVHRMVAEAFLGPMPPELETCHNDGDFTNNNIGNLRYDTTQSNSDDAKRHGTVAMGERSGTAKLSHKAAVEILTCARSAKELAREFGISEQTVSGIRTGTRWRRALAQVRAELAAKP